MKKILFLLFICSISFVNAQKNKIIKTAPLGFLFNTYRLGYEQEVTPNQSFTIDALYSNLSNYDLKITGPGLSVGYRFYVQDIGLFRPSVSNDPFEGFFVSPFASISSLEFDLGNDNFNATESSITVNGIEIDTTNSDGDIDSFNISMGAILGYQWNWTPITLELYLGAGVTKMEYDDNTSFSGSESGIGLTNLGFSVGYAF